MKYFFGEDFGVSLKALWGKSGPFRKAADTVHAMQAKARDGYEHKEIFSVATTHYGESRIPHCVKYDLTARARLVVVLGNNICIFLFAGDHDAADKWLDANKGIDFIAKKQGAAQVIEPVFVSEAAQRDGLIKTGSDLGAPDHLFDLISERYRNKLFDGLAENLVPAIMDIDSLASDDEILQIVDPIENEKQKIAVIDVVLKLREGDEKEAKNRIDLFCNEVKPIGDLTLDEISAIQSGERVVRIEDVDAAWFEHFVKTADFQEWMMYLHPAQRDFADRDYSGSVRLSGVSGSGKTCVLIHRALRLANKYPGEKILVVTLNAALATLIESLVQMSRGELSPTNLTVISFWQLCRDKLVAIEPANANLYTQQTIAPNPFAVTEHIDDIWDEYYNCENNNHTADLMSPLHRSLLIRNIFPKDYLKQEFDYLRSAFAPGQERKNYLEMERTGRSVPLDKPFRKQVLDGLAGWEQKMEFVGAIDSTGIATSLYKHLEQLQTEYRCVLVDEVQDFGTLELAILRKLTVQGENDLFLCGDAAQSVFTKYQDFDAAQINIRGGRSMRLQQNYRNSRQILTAAHDVLARNYETHSRAMVNLEILPPEYANFSSPKPLLLEAPDLRAEIEYAVDFGKAAIVDDERRKICIALAGYHQRGVEEIGQHLQLPVLNGDIDIKAGHIFLSDLEQTKGFEFDTMIILNAQSEVLPHPDLPSEESFRDLSKFYVAMTRAKVELIISYHGSLTSFIGDERSNFVEGKWSEGYSDRAALGTWSLPHAGVVKRRVGIEWDMTGKAFLKMPDAIGLPINAQEKLLECVTGKIAFQAGRRKKQKTWKSIGEFLNDMHQPLNRTSISLSDVAWSSIATHFGRPSAVPRS